MLLLYSPSATSCYLAVRYRYYTFCKYKRQALFSSYWIFITKEPVMAPLTSHYGIYDVLLWVRMRLGNLPPKRKKLLLHLIIGRLEAFEHHNGRG